MHERMKLSKCQEMTYLVPKNSPMWHGVMQQMVDAGWGQPLSQANSLKIFQLNAVDKKSPTLKQ